jgi:hypothetical protein
VDSHYRDCRSGKAGNQSYRSDLVAKPSGNRPLTEPGKPDLTAYDWSSVFLKKIGRLAVYLTHFVLHIDKIFSIC